MKNKAQDDRFDQPNKYTLPSPLELAKLAALLDGADHLCRVAPDAALIVAARLYVAAVDYHEHLALLTAEDLLLTLASPVSLSGPGLPTDEFIQNIYHRIRAGRETLRLYSDYAKPTAGEREQYFQDGLDGVRSYLMEHAAIFDWKTTRAVMENMLRHLKDLARVHNDLNREAIANYERAFEERYEGYLREFAKAEGIQVQDVSEFERAKYRRFTARMMHPRADEKRQTGKEQFRDFMQGHAVPSPDAPEKRAYNPANPKHVAYWNLPIQYLDQLIEWRRVAGKRPGGVSSLDHLE